MNIDSIKEKFRSLPDFFKGLPAILGPFFRRTWRYFAAAACFAAIVAVLVLCTSTSKVDSSDPLHGAYASYTTTTDQGIISLVNNYLDSYAAGNVSILLTLATPISDSEQSYIEFYSDYIEAFENVTIYTKPGVNDGEYLCSVYLEIKYEGIETAAPGVDFFYIATDENGEYYICNEYGSYNQTNGEYDMDTTVVALIAAFEQQEDVIALLQEGQQAYNEALLLDSDLSYFIAYTQQEAISAWATAYKTALAEAEAAAEAAAAAEAEAAALAEAEAEEAEEETEEAEEEAEEEEAEEEAAEEEAEAEEEEDDTEWETSVMYTTAKVNVRASASESGEKLGTLASGKIVACYSIDGDWAKIDYNDTVAYVKADYLAEGSASTRSVTCTATINIRSDRSESATKVTKASKGSTMLELYSYDDGWSKVFYDGQEGYCKTQYLQ